jgi:oxygen-dependent protoporphyrinogen oxidase
LVVTAARIAVVGGGISGLTAAHLLSAGGRDVTLFDDGDEPGGLIRSARRDGFLCERGPQSLLDGAEEVRALVASAGLTARALTALPASRRRFVFVGGALRPFPSSPPGLFKTSLLSAAGKARLFAEPFIRRPKAPDPDESVFDFVARRFGAEAARRAAAPALIGIYAGDAAAIAIRAAFPGLAAHEDAHGSVLRGMFRSRGGSRMGRPSSFPEGLAELPRALAAALGARRRAARVEQIAPRAGGWTVSAAGSTFDAERVLLATPAAVTAALLAPLAPGAAQALGAIRHAPVAVVTLGFRSPPPGSMGMDLEAYGFVVARGEGAETLGCQYETSVFAGRAPEGAVLVRALVGGTFNPQLVDADDTTLAGQVLADLRRVAGLKREPDFVDVSRARPGIPQYERGHTARVSAIDAELGRLPGLHAIGHALRGLGVSASIKAATEAARKIAADIDTST